ENGLYHFNYNDAVKDSMPDLPVTGPIAGKKYKVTSITNPITSDTSNNYLLITVFGESGAGVYLFNKSNSSWGSVFGTTYTAKKNQNDLITHVFDTSSVYRFTKLLTLRAQVDGLPTGFLLANEVPTA